MRITKKGQVTIPVDIRRQAGLLPDTEVEFLVHDGNIIIREAAAASGRGQRLVQTLRGRAQAAWPTADIMALTRGEDESDVPG
ncbi:MAG: AbrB/MazE/SpoVT family DNA-binding domain-containing protein [Spiribacter salinus]|uniref:AbrB/MazE/SpoVT family DNA-binding domain-containing protein n=1 Tax=Spiribacter salinus TaxID=1335746 RepID=A0A540VQ03_9GAMM|nr:MAG: AbrB/MazE/SpoVT family DNA-binding domain-containing protein [Spiribacter salinus]